LVLQVCIECVAACMTEEVDVQFGDIQRKEEKKFARKT
jgi:Fe-S-cluster containining protein